MCPPSEGRREDQVSVRHDLVLTSSCGVASPQLFPIKKSGVATHLIFFLLADRD